MIEKTNRPGRILKPHTDNKITILRTDSRYIVFTEARQQCLFTLDSIIVTQSGKSLTLTVCTFQTEDNIIECLTVQSEIQNNTPNNNIRKGSNIRHVSETRLVENSDRLKYGSGKH